MRKIFLHFAMTADGMVSNVEQWVSFTDEAMKDTSAYHDTVDTIIFGNNNYAPLAEYWQNAETSSNSAAERAFDRKVNDMHKLVLSHGRWNSFGEIRNCCAPKIAQHSSRRLHGSRTCQAKILQWILARAPGGPFWKMTCGTESICWSIPW
jgi:hypothetical protein